MATYTGIDFWAKKTILELSAWKEALEKEATEGKEEERHGQENV